MNKSSDVEEWCQQWAHWHSHRTYEEAGCWSWLCWKFDIHREFWPLNLSMELSLEVEVTRSLGTWVNEYDSVLTPGWFSSQCRIPLGCRFAWMGSWQQWPQGAPDAWDHHSSHTVSPFWTFSFPHCWAWLGWFTWLWEMEVSPRWSLVGYRKVSPDEQKSR